MAADQDPLRESDPDPAQDADPDLFEESDLLDPQPNDETVDPQPDDESEITETDLHPAEVDPYLPVNYAAEFQAILDKYRIKPRDLLPKTVVYLHVDRDTILNNTGVVRVEDIGPITADQFKHWLRWKHVTITPVIDPDNTPAIDSYQPPTGSKRPTHDHARRSLPLRHQHLPPDRP